MVNRVSISLACALALIGNFELAESNEPEPSVAEFEGCIEYRVEVDAAQSRISEAELRARFGSKMVECTGDGKYRTEFFGEHGTTWYLSSTNREYYLERGASELIVFEGGQPFLTVVNTTVSDVDFELLGYSLKRLVVEFDDGSEVRVWFAPDLRIDPAPFLQHRFAGAYVFFQIAQSAALIVEVHSKLGYVRRDTAVSVSPGQLPESVFQIPNLPQKVWEP